MSGQTPAQLLRDMQARNLAARRYAAAYDHFATEVQRFAAEDKPRREAKRYADWAFRAWQAELDDPEPTR